MEINKQPARLGRPPKQEARKTRECLLNAAMELFATQGFAGTSLRQIAQAVGIKESAIYAHFESKEALCRTIFEQFGPPTAIVDELLGSDPSIIAQLEPEAVLRDLVRRIISRWDEPRARLFLCLALREGTGDAASGRSLLQPAKKQVLEHLTPVMQHWREQGLIRKDFPVEQLIWELLAPLFIIRIAYWHARATEEERQLGHQRADLHLEYFLRTVLTDKTDNPQDKGQ